MKFNDAISGALLLALAIAVLVAIQSFPQIPGQNIGPGAFPGLLAVLLAFCAFILIFRGLKERAGERWVVFGAWLRSLPHLRSFLVTVACLVFYIVTSNALGFIICGILLLCAMMWTVGTRPQIFIPVAIVATLVVHTIFYKGLRVPLPWGVLMPFAW
ncbi:MAG TPA: tripartite tricarboxylate transporter TctB family protein [Burkholderiales bacterium]|jgi:putative tricarboxylic transport membrane protein